MDPPTYKSVSLVGQVCAINGTDLSACSYLVCMWPGGHGGDKTCQNATIVTLNGANTKITGGGPVTSETTGTLSVKSATIN